MILKFKDFLSGVNEKKCDGGTFSPDVPKFDPGVYNKLPDDDHREKIKKEGKLVSGIKEVIEVIGLGKMKAKLDSGNTALNALIVKDYNESKDGKVKFDFDGEERTYDVVKHIRIWHHGKTTERPVIRVDIKFNGKLYKDELVDLKISDLTGTKNYRSRMLLCKDFMKRAMVVIDPSKEFELTDKKEIKKKKKKK